LALWLRQRS